MMPSNHKRFIVLEKAFNIVIKWNELGHVWIHNLRLKEILHKLSEDFFRPKILYPDIMRLPRNKEKMDKYPYFYYDTKNFFPEATLFLMVGDQLPQVYDFLCSEIGLFIFSKYYMGPVFDSTGFRYKKDYLCNLPVPKVKVDSSGAEDYEIKLSELLGLSREEMDYIHQYKDNLLL